MSAFVLNLETLTRIADTIAKDCNYPNNKPFLNMEPLQQLLKDCRSGFYRDYDGDMILERLHDMNARAVATRYKEEPEAMPAQSILCKPYQNHFELIKAIDCYLYQCAEGKVPEEALYKALEAYNMQHYKNIVRSMEEYQAAPWG